GEARQQNGAAAFAPGAFIGEDDPRHPAQGSAVVGPHQRVPGKTVEGKSRSRDGGSEAAACPAISQEIHSHAREKKMSQAEHAQRPRKRKEEIKNRKWIESQSVPLGGEREAAIVERVPQWHLAAPEGFAVI